AFSAGPAPPAGLAADGRAGRLRGSLPRRGVPLHAEQPCSLLVAPADAPGRWHVTIGPGGRQVHTDGELPADCTVRGRATDLYLALWNRTPAEPPAVSGDPAVLDLWHARAKITWR